jgi:hypothetical protein
LHIKINRISFIKSYRVFACIRRKMTEPDRQRVCDTHRRITPTLSLFPVFKFKFKLHYHEKNAAGIEPLFTKKRNANESYVCVGMGRV